MSSIADRLHAVEQRIRAACRTTGRAEDAVRLMAVGKLQQPSSVREAFEAGQRLFGENYVQEAVGKMEALGDLRAHIEWHLIGPLQANKTRIVAERFDAVHSIDRLKIAERLAGQRPEGLAPLGVYLQVNVDDETSKSGVAPAELAPLAHAVAALPRLELRGLMSIPGPAARVASHRRLRELRDGLRRDGLAIDGLSMGMSEDLEAAVIEGSTVVRIGTAIFGARGRAAAPSFQKL